MSDEENVVNGVYKKKKARIDDGVRKLNKWDEDYVESEKEANSSEEEQPEEEEEVKDNQSDDDEAFVLSQVNSKVVATGDMVVQRQPLMAGLSVRGEEDISIPRHRQKFIAPRQDNAKAAQFIIRTDLPARPTLGARRRKSTGLLKFGSFKALDSTLDILDMPFPEDLKVAGKEGEEEEEEDKVDELLNKYEPLVVWEPNEQELAQAAIDGKKLSPIIIEPCIGKFLRTHQREGVRFLCECVLQQGNFEGAGAILADDMGLGKTLQSITLLYTLLRQGFEEGVPLVQRAIIVCPTSLVSNWENELKKWLKGAVPCVALSEASKDKVISGIDDFLSPRSKSRVLIISYETFRLHANHIRKSERPTNQPNAPPRTNCCDLLICDEAHRLKNSDTSTYEALFALSTPRRVLLSGTPMQNDLNEFYSMVNFTNPNVLGVKTKFARYFQNPILKGREPYATDKEKEVAEQRSMEMSTIVNQFILRRTNAILSGHLPPKVTQVVVCGLSPLQDRLYRHFIKSKELKSIIKQDGKTPAHILPMISALKKLCNHPKLIYDMLIANKKKNDGDSAVTLSAFKGALELFPEDFKEKSNNPTYSGKMDVLDKLLRQCRAQTDDRVVVVSNYTQTLDMIGDLCVQRKWAFLRLDGSTTVKKRQPLVDQLTSRQNDNFVFLLSSKAGGCGLNLIGANRLVLFDPDWNPAVDKQAAARVWRDGQKKRCFVYRFVSTGTIEEKVYQRQLSKEGLKDVIGGKAGGSLVSVDDLKDLFSLMPDTLSDTHDTLGCSCGGSDIKIGDMAKALNDGKDWDAQKRKPLCLQKLEPSEEDMVNWSHHNFVSTVPDAMLRASQTLGLEDLSDQVNCKSGSSSSKFAGPARISSRPGRGTIDRFGVKTNMPGGGGGGGGWEELSEFAKEAYAGMHASSPKEVAAIAHSDGRSATAKCVNCNYITFVYSCEVNGMVISPQEEARHKAISAISISSSPPRVNKIKARQVDEDAAFIDKGDGEGSQKQRSQVSISLDSDDDDPMSPEEDGDYVSGGDINPPEDNLDEEEEEEMPEKEEVQKPAPVKKARKKSKEGTSAKDEMPEWALGMSKADYNMILATMVADGEGGEKKKRNRGGKDKPASQKSKKTKKEAPRTEVKVVARKEVRNLEDGDDDGPPPLPQIQQQSDEEDSSDFETTTITTTVTAAAAKQTSKLQLMKKTPKPPVVLSIESSSGED